MCIWKVSPEDRLCKYCIVTKCPDRNLGKARYGSIISALRGLAVGKSVEMGIDRYNSCRVSATRLHNLYGSQYIVRTTEDSVIVERLK